MSDLLSEKTVFDVKDWRTGKIKVGIYNKEILKSALPILKDIFSKHWLDESLDKSKLKVYEVEGFFKYIEKLIKEEK